MKEHSAMVFTSTNPPSGYYVYAYIRASDSTPYYIGKGKDGRAWAKHKGTSIPKDQSKIIILEHNLTEIGALAIERRMITWYGRKDNNTGILINRSDGGEGTCGYKYSTEQRLAITGEKNHMYGKVGKDSPSYGRIVSEETRAKMRAAKIGRKLSEEHRAKIGNAERGEKNPNYGKKFTLEHRAKLSAAAKLRIKKIK